MKSSTKDRAEGAFHEVNGKLKEIVGIITDNPTLQVKGKIEQITGEVQEKVGRIKKVFGK